jgi:hypothetical protein
MSSYGHIKLLLRVTACIAVISGILYFCPSGNAQADMLRIISSEEVTTRPSELIVATLRISNPTDHKVRYRIDTEMPQGWKVVSGDTPVEIEAQDGILRIVSFFVPGSVPAGEYVITFRLMPEGSDQVLEEGKIRVIVEAMPHITITQTGVVKNSVLAGENINLEYKIQNHGNVRTSLNFEIIMNKPAISSVKPQKMELDLNESGSVNVAITLDEKTREVTNFTAQLTGLIIDDEGRITSRIESSILNIKVFPKSSPQIDEYHRLPGEIKFKSVVEDRTKPRYDYQFIFSLDGPIDPEEGKFIDIFYRGPDHDSSMIFYNEDEQAHIGYEQDDFGIYVGDGYYGLTPLIDLSKTGRGIKLNAKYDIFNVETYYMNSLRTPLKEEVVGASVGMQFDENNIFSVNLLNVDAGEDVPYVQDDRQIVGFRGQFGDGKTIDTDIEVAKGGDPSIEGSDLAWKLSARYRDEGKEFHIRHINSGPAFGGYYRDMELTELSTSLPLGNGLKLQANMLNQDRNYITQSSIQTTIQEKYARLGALYNGYPGTSLTFDYVFRDRSGSGDYVLFDSVEKFWQLGASQNIGNVTVGGRVEYGDNEDRILGDTVMHLSQLGTVSWRIDDKWSVNSFAGYRRGDTLDINRGTSVSSGLSLRYADERKTVVSTGINMEVVRHQSRRTYIPFLFKHEFAGGDEIEIRARHSRSRRNNRESSDTAVMVNYSIPLSFKVGRRTDISTLTGYVRDIENENKGMPGILVHTENQASLTDENGRYILRNLKPGANLLTVNLQDAGYNRITVPHNPVEINLKGGEMQFDFDVVTAAMVMGCVKPQEGFTGEFKPVDMLVELKYGDQTEYRLTDENGEFNFEGLVPGHYVFIIDTGSLPRDLSIEQTQYEFDLTPGQKYNLQLELKPREIEVEIIKSGEELKIEK